MSNTVRLASLTSFSSVDGPGLRTVIWFQGCVHQCVGCHNPQTHDLNAGYLVEVSDLLNQVRAINHKKITISGGDPFLQKHALNEICIALKAEGYHIWIYTGYEIEMLIKDDVNRSILKHSDVLVDGKFVYGMRDIKDNFKGSLNQRIININKYLTGLSIEDSIIK